MASDGPSSLHAPAPIDHPGGCADIFIARYLLPCAATSTLDSAAATSASLLHQCRLAAWLCRNPFLYQVLFQTHSRYYSFFPFVPRAILSSSCPARTYPSHNRAFRPNLSTLRLPKLILMAIISSCRSLPLQPRRDAVLPISTACVCSRHLLSFGGSGTSSNIFGASTK